MNVQIVILAAGKGTRMKSELPKVLADLKGKPLIMHLLDSIAQIPEGRNPIIVVGHKHDIVQETLGEKFTYAFQPDQLGTAHAAESALPQVSAENLLILYGDMPFITAQTLTKLIEKHAKSKSVFSMFTTIVPNFESPYEALSNFGRIIRDEAGKILEIKELVDASEEQRAITEVNPGIYLFRTEWLKENINKIQKNKHGEYFLTDIVEVARRQGIDIITQASSPKEVFGINTPEHLKQAHEIY